MDRSRRMPSGGAESSLTMGNSIYTDLAVRRLWQLD